MKSANGNSLANGLKRGADVVAQGLELKPVTGPVKNVTAWMTIPFAIILIGAKFSLDLVASATLREIGAGAIVVAFCLLVAVLLLQWNRSNLWHRTLAGKRTDTSSPTGARQPE